MFNKLINWVLFKSTLPWKMLVERPIQGNRLTSLVCPTLLSNINAAKNSILSHGMSAHWLIFYGLGNTDPGSHL